MFEILNHPNAIVFQRDLHAFKDLRTLHSFNQSDKNNGKKIQNCYIVDSLAIQDLPRFHKVKLNARAPINLLFWASQIFEL